MLLASLCLAAVVAHAPAAPAAEVKRVGIRDSYYTIAFRVITVDDSVQWENTGSNGHTVVAYDGSFDSSPLTLDGSCEAPLLGEERDCIEPGESFTLSFDRKGDYEYYCKVDGHADPSVRPDPGLGPRDQPCGMCGVIRVKKETVVSRPSNQQTVTPTTSVTPTKKPKKSPTASPSASSSVTASGTAISTLPAADSGTGGRLGVAFLAILALGGVGYYTWRRFIAP